MFGSVYRMKLKPGQESALLSYSERWIRERQPMVKGAVALHVLRKVDDPRQFMGVAIFDSRESYFANANDPEQDRWYRELVELLEEPPVFEDGEVVFSWISDQAAKDAVPHGL